MEARLLFEFVQECVVHVGDEGEAFAGLAPHEFPDHRLEIVFRDKAAHHQIVFLRFQIFLGEPVREFGSVVC